MSNHSLQKELLPDEELARQLEAVFGSDSEIWLTSEINTCRENRLITGRVISVVGDGVLVDVGFKSEAVISLREWQDPTGVIVPPQVGDEVLVFVINLENDEGTLVLSHRKARRLVQWAQFVRKHKEDDQVSGIVLCQVRSGLLVDVGITAFLPVSQIDIRRPANLEEYVGKRIDAVILRLDRKRQNVIISRRRVHVHVDPLPQYGILGKLAVGQVRKGVVKNIAEFGAFVDLGGIDGLLHITDMSWGRVNNVHDIVRLDQELDVYILEVDLSKVKVRLSLKHLTPSPWVNVHEKYPVGSWHQGEVINIMSYGAFVQLEFGIVGLVHISEMHGPQPIQHPAELVKVGDIVEVQVVNINAEKSEISLRMRRATPNT